MFVLGLGGSRGVCCYGVLVDVMFQFLCSGSLNGLCWNHHENLDCLMLDPRGCAWLLESLGILAVCCEQHCHDSFSSSHNLWA
eukprot:4287895-Amphidinium_carterae.1